MTLDAQLATPVVSDDEPAMPNQGSDHEQPSPDSLLLIVDPSLALEAARRMEANCRNGLRFFSDFRRVRPLDSFQLDEDGEALEGADDVPEFEAPEDRFNPRFDPALSRH
jgi:hypothetical protein